MHVVTGSGQRFAYISIKSENAARIYILLVCSVCSSSVPRLIYIKRRHHARHEEVNDPVDVAEGKAQASIDIYTSSYI